MYFKHEIQTWYDRVKKREREKKRFKVRKRIDREHYIRLNIIKVTNIVKIHNSKSKKFRGENARRSKEKVI